MCSISYSGDLKEKMSIVNWFTSKQSVEMDSVPESSGLEQLDATVPLMSPDRLRVKAAATPAGHAEHRKTERLEHRKHIYSVVRDSMIRAGVLAASYKFKVLSLDAHGIQYLIMMDLTDHSAGDTGRLAEIEALMAQTAKLRHDILITAVYWRVNEHVTAGLSRSPPVPLPQAPRKAPEQPPSRQPATAVTSGRRKPAPPVEFEDTQKAVLKERAAPLSGTQ